VDDENRKVLVKNPGRVALVLAGAGLVVTLVLAVVLAIALQPSQSVSDCLAVHGFESNPASDSAVYAAALEHCGG
jgi:hypothetical protein